MANIKIQLDADTGRAIKGIEGFSRDASSALDGLNSTFNIIKGAAAAAFAVFLGNEVIDGIKKITGAAAENEASIAKLNTALKLSGDYSDKASQRFVALADELENITAIDDDIILSSTAVAKSFNLTNDQTEKLIRSAVDLSAVTGQDLRSSVELLGKSYDGTAGRLNELVPGVKKLTAAQLEAGGAVDLISERFKGAAAAAANTFEGSLKKLETSSDNLFTSMGKIITQNPVVNEGIKLVNEGVKALDEIIKANSKTIGKYITEGLLGIANAAPAVVDAVGAIGQVTKGATKFLELMGLGALEAVRVLLSFEPVKVVFQAILDSVSALNTVFFKLASAVLDILSAFSKLGPVQDLMKELGINVDDLRDSLKNASKSTDELSKGFQVTSDDAISVVVDLQNELGDLTNDTDKTFRSFQKSVDKTADKTAALVESINDIGAAQVKASNDATDALKNQIKQVEELTKAQRKQVLDSAAANPIAALAGQTEFPKGTTPLDIGLGIGGGIIQAIGKGAEGAAQLISQGLGVAADFLLPGLGGIVTQISNLLAQGPEKVKEFISSFVNGIPQVLTNIAQGAVAFVQSLKENLPGFITAFTNAIPDIIEALIVQLPEAITALNQALIDQTPRIIFRIIAKLGEGLINTILAGFEFVLNAMLDIMTLGLNSIDIKLPRIHGSGEAEFAKGGTIPGGFPNDSFTGKLTSGELVVPRDDVHNLREFLDSQSGNKQGNGGSSEATLIAAFKKALEGSKGQNVAINLKIGERELSNALISLNRQGFPTS